MRRGHIEREIITRINGQESVEIAIYKAGGTNTVKVSAAVQDALEGVRERLGKIDPDLQVTLITDQGRYIRRSVDEVLETALYGGLLAVLVLFLFLRSARATLIIATAIPISVVATFFLMYLSNVSLNIMSLGGLTLGIGLLVDNAIVVLEAIERRRSGGLGAAEAARVGASEVATAIIASTLTSICVFLPIVFVEGVAAQFFADQALTVTWSLLASLLVALTVIPMLASRQRGIEETDSSAPSGWLSSRLFSLAVGVGRLFKGLFRILFVPLAALLAAPANLFQAGFERFTRFYDRLLAGALRYPWIVLLVALLAFGGSLTLFSTLGQELVPELVQGEFFFDAELPPGTNLEVTQRRLASLERSVGELDGVETVYALLGSTGQQGGVAAENREHLARVTVTLAPPFDREREDRLMDSVRARVAEDDDLEVQFGRPSYFSFKTPVEVEIRGYNLELLRRYSETLAEGMRNIPGLTDVETSMEGGTPELRVRFDRQRLAAWGLALQPVAAALQAKVQGTVASEIQRDDRTIDIRVRSREEDRNSIQDLRNLVVAQQGGAAIPLSAVAQVEEAEGPAEIRRVDGERAALLTANLEGRDLGSAAAEIEGLIVDLGLPLGFDSRLGGQQKEMETSFESLKLALFLAIFLVYLVMASQFESLLHPLVILGSVPLSLIGVFVTLWLFEVRLSVVVMIGVVLLAGIVVNNAIILVDTTNRLRREKGLAKIEALQLAGRQRLRPILMTSATTVLGLLPMAIGLGEGSELRAPMAMAVVGGLLSATALTLVVIPVVYRVVDRGK